MQRLLLTLCVVALAVGTAKGQAGFINEFHYDNVGDDVGEFIEVALLTTEDPAAYFLELYNGNNASNVRPYGTPRSLNDCETGDSSGGYTLYVCNYPKDGIQNGPRDGIALGSGTTLIQFISYEGVITAHGGIAEGVTATDVGVSETSSTPIGYSISWTGVEWNEPNPATPGRLNSGQSYLPVELTSFSALASNNGAVLRWMTAGETNNAGFDVQQRIGADYRTIGFVAGHGTTVEARQYVFQVNDLVPGTYRFRLKQIDFDGAFEFSPEVELTVMGDGLYMLSEARPNPMRDQSAFTLSVQRSQQVTVGLYNALGQHVATLFDGHLADNEARAITIEGAPLPAGVYLYRVQGETFADSRTITIVR